MAAPISVPVGSGKKKMLTEKESARKIKDLKIELLKNPMKKKSIKKEIARLLTMGNIQTKLEKKK